MGWLWENLKARQEPQYVNWKPNPNMVVQSGWTWTSVPPKSLLILIHNTLEQLCKVGQWLDFWCILLKSFPFIAGRYPGQRLAAEYLPPMKVVSEFVRRGDERGAAKIMEMRSWKWLPTGDSLDSKDHKFQNWILGLILLCYYKALEKKVQSLCVLRMWSVKSCDLSKPFYLLFCQELCI